MIVRILTLMGILWLFSCKTVSYFQQGDLIAADDQPTEIPFNTLQNLIIIEASINGVPGLFLVDNGFSLSAVNKSFAEKAGIEFKGKSKVTDANNKKAVLRRTRVDKLEFGGHIFVNTGFYEIDTKKFLPCDTLDGVIGASVINKINWQVDFQNNRIKLSSQPFDADGFEIKVSYLTNNNTNITLRIEDVEVNTKVDMGSTQNIKLKKSMMGPYFKGKEVVTEYGIMSLSATGLGEPDTIYRVKDPRPLFYRNNALPVEGRILLSGNMKYDGYIGIDYLNDYLLTINSTRSVYILSDPSPPETYLDPGYGISIYKVGKTWKVIKKVADDARLTGLPLMATIESLDGNDMSVFEDLCAFRNYMNQKKESGEILELKIASSSAPFRIAYTEAHSRVLGIN